HVAEHLPAAARAVARRERRDPHAAPGPAVQVGPVRRWRGVPPREEALPPALRRPGRRRLPLGLGREAPSGPAAIRLGLVPADVDHRAVRLQRYPAVEVAPLPAARLASPVGRLFRARALPPEPPLRAPPGAASAAAG